MSFTYNIVKKEDGTVNLTVMIDGDLFHANETHPNFLAIIDALVKQQVGEEIEDEELRDLFDVSFSVGQKFDRLSDRVTVSNGRIYMDGEEVHSTLTDTILRFQQEQQDFKPLVNFFEKIQTNPNAHSREHLYRWLQLHSYSIAEDGDFIAYKGIRDGNSITPGEAMVNGEWIHGVIPNPIGAVIEMPRSHVTFDPAQGCSVGLHVATWAFASSFGPVVVKVKINPRDVVSVPVDSGDAKMRVCRYTVLEVVQQENKRIFEGDEDFEDDDEEFDVPVPAFIEPTRLATRIRNIFRNK